MFNISISTGEITVGKTFNSSNSNGEMPPIGKLFNSYISNREMSIGEVPIVNR